MNKRNGLLVVISSPSGGGKTTVMKYVIADADLHAIRSVSMTTRPRRRREENGRDYYFVDQATFAEQIAQGELIEYESIHGYDYGTPNRALKENLAQDNVILLTIDVRGALSIRKIFPDNSLLIFLQPPDVQTLRKRLLHRGTETPEEIEKRLARVAEEIELAQQFDCVIINDCLDDTVMSVKKKIKEKLQQMNHPGKA